MKIFTKNIAKILYLLPILIFLSSCGIYKPTDAKEFPPEPEKRVAKNIEEGRGFKSVSYTHLTLPTTTSV